MLYEEHFFNRLFADFDKTMRTNILQNTTFLLSPLLVSMKIKESTVFRNDR